MESFDGKREVLDFGLEEDRNSSLSVQLEFVADKRVGPSDQHGGVQNWKNNYFVRPFSYFEIGSEDSPELPHEGWFGGSNGRQLQHCRLRKQKSLLLELVVDSIWHKLIKINGS